MRMHHHFIRTFSRDIQAILVHSGSQCARDDLVPRTTSQILPVEVETRSSHDVHDGSPTTQSISVHRIQQHLRDRLEQVLRFLPVSSCSEGATTARSNTVSSAAWEYTHQIWLPQTLSHTVQLILRRARNRKVLRRGDTTDPVRQLCDREATRAGSRVHGGDEGLRLGVELGRVGQSSNNGLKKPRAESAHELQVLMLRLYQLTASRIVCSRGDA